MSRGSETKKKWGLMISKNNRSPQLELWLNCREVSLLPRLVLSAYSFIAIEWRRRSVNKKKKIRRKRDFHLSHELIRILTTPKECVITKRDREGKKKTHFQKFGGIIIKGSNANVHWLGRSNDSNSSKMEFLAFKVLSRIIIRVVELSLTKGYLSGWLSAAKNMTSVLVR